MAAVVGRDGFQATTVNTICDHANLPRQAFFTHYESVEECFLAVLDNAYDHCMEMILRAFQTAENWRDGIREALCSLLALFESRPDVARLWMLESMTAGRWALERRERNVSAMTAAIVERWRPPPAVYAHPLAITTAMAGVLGTIQRHLVRDRPGPLIELLGPLMGVATGSFLEPREVAAEIQKGERLAGEVASGARRPAGLGAMPSVEVPSSLLHPRAHRVRECLLYLARSPGASNREAARAIGVSSAAQISSLLSRLAGLDLARAERSGPGRPNAWHLTEAGQAAAHALLGTNSAGPGTSVPGPARRLRD